ncbi:glutamyl-tRNA synthetase [Gloeophyllum trabeum ATCC 11539]|uniref:Glutamate--tRNA ligase, mitochondrial n=1 Tax=Gloeophyllum trabeum (strain ATCC 11539 / FP-39264 / Madison 617) TaxID=670483 RepID=S7QNY7_GLOTA|nr:glutamyl-tRNA synthetase [Gloeophyllum trabeum ATCC 11539]EPQ61238.1 glutamyl-tRNA synthetase [Gloeophyllum trabeum ATCC 11539]
MVLLRFAPSPTGSLHLGGLRTALYNYLYARKHGGKWILRIEDTDATRYVPGAVDNIRESLNWAGLEYDYGPIKGGPHGPYFQSERLDLYKMYANKLLESGRAYRCFCTPDRLSATRERLARSGSNETYDKACLHLTDEEVARRVRAGEKHIIRLNDGNLPQRPAPHDIVFGALKDTHASLPTDPVLLKSDLFPTYHLASVVDDHEMGISHVVRGEEWLPSLPLHLDLYACLSLAPPQFAHLPILLNNDGTKMSKRKGDVQVMDYIRRGWEPAAVLNWLALAGWGVQHENPDTSAGSTSASSAPAPDSTALMTLSELIEKFDLSALTHRRSVLDPKKLEYINKHHLTRAWSTPEGLDNLAARLHDSVKAAFPLSQYTTEDYIKKVIPTLQERVTNLQQFPFLAPYFFIEPDFFTAEAHEMVKSISPSEYSDVTRAVAARLEKPDIVWDQQNISAALHEESTKSGIKSRVFMTILRHALTGMKTGPSVAEIMHTIGPERTLERLHTIRGSPLVSKM